MKFINLTPHQLNITDTIVPTSGTIVRIDYEENQLDFVENIPVYQNNLPVLVDMPEPQENIIYLVSGMVLPFCGGRTDVFAPDTGSRAVRNDAGHITSVTSLLAPPRHLVNKMQVDIDRAVDSALAKY